MVILRTLLTLVVGATLVGLTPTATMARACEDAFDSECTEVRSPTPARNTQSTQRVRRKQMSHRSADRNRPPSSGAAMRGEDRTALMARLMARLPWWRAAPWQVMLFRMREAESPVLVAAGAWLGSPFVAVRPAAGDEGVQLVSADEVNAIDLAADIVIVESNAINEIDRMAPDEPQAGRSWFHGLLALLGGALAAASMARLLLV